MLVRYICGPTVYDDSHIGHARTYVSFDIMRRILRNRGIMSNLAIGITDLDDKIIKQSQVQGMHYQELARHFEDRFVEDLSTLGVDLPSSFLRVTEHIEEILEFIRKLVGSGYAYVSEGSVYFSVSAFGMRFIYGKFRNTATNDTGMHPDSKEPPCFEKKDHRDFALWKARSPDTFGPVWNSPWGPGRPGWHIECSAMSNN